jgi:hypothetical protein
VFFWTNAHATACVHREKYCYFEKWGGFRHFKLCSTMKVIAVLGLLGITNNLIQVGNIIKPAMAST